MESKYWEEKAKREPLEPMKKMCEDCAIKTGFYRDFLDELLTKPKEIREAAARSWFCHDNPNKCCAGVQIEVFKDAN